MIVIIANIFLAITDLIIPIFATNVFFKKKITFSKYMVFLLIITVVLKLGIGINYAVIDIIMFILIEGTLYKKIKNKELVYYTTLFILINLMILPIINIVSFSLFSGYENSLYIESMLFNGKNVEFICKNIIMIYFLMYQNKNFKDIELENFAKKYWYYYYLISLMCFLSIVILIVICDYYDKGMSIIFSILSSVIVIFLYVYYVLFKSLYYNSVDKYNMLIEKSELQIKLNGLLENKKTIEELKKFRHDIENNLNVISYMLERKHYKNAHDYISEYLNDFDKICQINFSIENLVISAIINEKMRKYQDVVFEIQCFISDQIRIKDIDFATILGNLLENAAEYVANSNVDKRVFVVIMEYYESNIYVEIRNQFIGQFDKENYITTKLDKKNHGYGLMNVVDIVNKYNGYIEVETNDNVFKTQILLQEELKC